MKIFGFVKNVSFVGSTVLSSVTKANSLSCISMNSQECKTRSQVINVNRDEHVFFHSVLKQVNVMVVLIILTIHMYKFVFLIL